MKQKKVCSIDGCNKTHYGHGYCSPHYQRWYKHGDPGTNDIKARAKLTENQVARIRRMSGTHKEIASLFGVERSTVSNIKRGVRWT